MELKMPKSIENCPIVDALVEIRFKSNLPSNAIFGILYNSLNDDLPNVTNLPILQLPETIRVSDPNLKYKPLYKINNDKFVVQIGVDVLTISSYPLYLGWSTFYDKIDEILSKIEELNVVEKVERFGIRYINFFNSDIFNSINLNISWFNGEFLNNNTIIKTEISHTNFNSILQLSNNAYSNDVKGSIIDIDTYTNNGLNNFFINRKEIIYNAHNEEKKLFFSLLTSDFIDSLKPKY